MKTLAAHFLLTLLCVVCYYDTLNGEFVFDDVVAIVKNDDVSNYSTNITAIFSHDFWGQNLIHSNSHKSYRPLITLMFRFEYTFFKFKAAAMKAINLLLHCLNTSLFFVYLLNITSNWKTALIASSLFAVHPIHTEAVCGIVCRAELMFSLFFLISLIVYANLNHGKQSLCSLACRYFILIGLSICGLLSKENAISILPCCICYDIIMRTNMLQKGSNRYFVKKRVLIRCVFLLILTVFLLIGRLYIQNFKNPEFKSMDNPIAFLDSFFAKYLSQNYLYILNIWLMLCPEWLSFDWAMGCIEIVRNLFDLRCILIAVFYAIIYRLSVKRVRLISLSLTLLIVPFLPASGLIRVGFVIAERILYVPSMGFCLLVALGFVALVNEFSKLKQFLYVLLVFIIIVYIFRTRQRAREWTTEEILFNSGLKVCPNNAKVHYNIARLASDKGDRDKAIRHYHESIRLHPQYESALVNLGNIYKEIGDYITAEKYLKQSIEVFEQFPSAWMNLGIVQAAQKKYDEALKSYEKALSYKNRYPICLFNLGNLYLDMKNYSMAMQFWTQSVAIKANQPKPWSNILLLLDNQGLHEDVLRLSERALTHLPNDTSILFIRANTLGKLKNYIESEQLYLRVIQMNPKNPMYLSNLGVLYHKWGKSDLAIEYYKAALKIDQNFTSAKSNLKMLLKNN